ncbi:Hypothetical predicted protein [Lecanosticta acicola]|uniref:Uncharacterized protein n=1 Tax=Lecanosticta acicola TaxID=111012 RepID=A0AAI9E7U7_9PEZI|nr:Hypothetical predicted protein [Lecanosticta acicola]
MARTWTAQRNEQLLLLLVDKVSFGKDMQEELAKQWTARYPGDDYQPTARALKEQIAALKNRAAVSESDKLAGGTTKTEAKGVKAARQTSSKRSAPKTPTSSAKKARARGRMSDEDIDSDDSENVNLSSITKRQTFSRRSTALKKTYAEEATSDEDDELVTSGVKRKLFTDKIDEGIAKSPSAILTEHGGRSSKARSKKDPPKIDYFADDAHDSEEELL